MQVVVFVGIIAIVVIWRIVHELRHEENVVAKGCLISFLTGFVIFLLLLGYYFYNVDRCIKADLKWNDQTDMSAVDKERWSYYVAFPEAEHCFEYYSVRGVVDPRYMIETRAYQSVEEMCDDLPEGCEDAISSALLSEPKEEEDTRGVDIKQYKVENDRLPLISNDEIERKYDAYAVAGWREYYVNEYEDGTYRFILCYQKA